MINFVTSRAKGPVGEWIWGKYLERLADEGYLSQAEFARQLGIAQSLLNHYINGRRLPTGEQIAKLATLGPEIYDLLGMVRPDPRLNRLIEAYNRATPEQREEIIRQAFRVIGYEPEDPGD